MFVSINSLNAVVGNIGREFKPPNDNINTLLLNLVQLNFHFASVLQFDHWSINLGEYGRPTYYVLGTWVQLGLWLINRHYPGKWNTYTMYRNYGTYLYYSGTNNRVCSCTYNYNCLQRNVRNYMVYLYQVMFPIPGALKR